MSPKLVDPELELSSLEVEEGDDDDDDDDDAGPLTREAITTQLT